MMTHEPNGLGQCTLNQRFMDLECLVNHEDNRLQCTMKREMKDHETMNHGVWTKESTVRNESMPYEGEWKHVWPWMEQNLISTGSSKQKPCNEP